jgi:hypothetical protein
MHSISPSVIAATGLQNKPRGGASVPLEIAFLRDK